MTPKTSAPKKPGAQAAGRPARSAPTSAPAVPRILPREPLTKKAEAAIYSYLAARTRGGPMFAQSAVKLVLQAERMRRADLYAWLEGRGYQWSPRVGVWSSPSQPPPNQASSSPKPPSPRAKSPTVKKPPAQKTVPKKTAGRAVPPITCPECGRIATDWRGDLYRVSAPGDWVECLKRQGGCGWAWPVLDVPPQNLEAPGPASLALGVSPGGKGR